MWIALNRRAFTPPPAPNKFNHNPQPPAAPPLTFTNHHPPQTLTTPIPSPQAPTYFCRKRRSDPKSLVGARMASGMGHHSLMDSNLGCFCWLLLLLLLLLRCVLDVSVCG